LALYLWLFKRQQVDKNDVLLVKNLFLLIFNLKAHNLLKIKNVKKNYKKFLQLL